MTDFILRRCGINDIKSLRHASTASACALAIFDIYTDINTVYTLYTSTDNQLCSYNCPAVLATTLVIFILYSMITQAQYVYDSYDGNYLYTFLSLLGYAPIVIAMDMWDDIGNNKKYKRFFRIRWMETTHEALPAAAIQIVVVLFFSTSLTDASEVSSLVEIQRLQSTILIFISIIISLWSVGNGTRKYCAFVGKFNKPIWYYYALALYTATDMFNRSLILSLFFVSLNVGDFDVYVIMVVVAVVIHQILFHFINDQRDLKTGLDSGIIGRFITSNKFIFGLFIVFYMVLPSSVVFLRNFHVRDANISYWITWINGFGMILGGILFFILRVTLNNKLNILYTAGVIYILSANMIPYVLVLYGRLKKRYNDETEEEPPNLAQQFSITMEEMEMSPQKEKELEKEEEEKEDRLTVDRAAKIQRAKEKDERERQEKAQRIRKKQELKAKRLQELEEERKAKQIVQKRQRELKDKAVREKQKAEDERVKKEFEKREREKAERLEKLRKGSNTDNNNNNNDSYDPRFDDDTMSTFSEFGVSMDKYEEKQKKKNKQHRKTKSNVDTIKENVQSGSEEESDKKESDTTNLFSFFSKDKKKKEENVLSKDDKKKKKKRANSDQLSSDSTNKKQKELKNRTKHSESNAENEKKLKLNNKITSEKKKKKKNQRSSSMTPMTKTQKDEERKKLKLKGKNEKNENDVIIEKKGRKKTST